MRVALNIYIHKYYYEIYYETFYHPRKILFFFPQQINIHL